MSRSRSRARDPHLDPFRELLTSVTVFLLGKNATRSQISMAMQRALVEAVSLRRDSEALETLYIALSSVIHAWHDDRRYLDEGARPRPLTLRGRSDSIQSLARVAGVRVPYGRLLESLVSQKLIRKSGKSRYLPTRSVVRLVRDGPELTGYLGQSILQLTQTLESNRRDRRTRKALLERAAIVDDLSPKDAAAFRRYCAEQGAAFISNANSWLESRRMRSARAGANEGGITAGVHVFAFLSSGKRGRSRNQLVTQGSS